MSDFFDDFDIPSLFFTNDDTIPELPSLDCTRHAMPLTDEEKETIRMQSLSESSKKQSKWGVNALLSWAKERFLKGSISVLKSIEEWTKSDLKWALPFFISEVRKQDGTEYPRDTLKAIINGIMWHFNNIEHKNFNIWADVDFLDTKKQLDACMKKSFANGVKPMQGKAAAITEQDEMAMWEYGSLGSDNGRQLNRTLIYLAGTLLTIRGGKEMRNLEFGRTLLLKTDEHGDYLEYIEDVSKTHTGGLRDRNIEPKRRKISSTGDDSKCFVSLIKKQISLR